MTTRREFLGSVGALAAFAFLPRTVTVRSLRIGVGVGAVQGDFGRGVTFGIAEATRTGKLFGWTVESVGVTGTDAPGVHAMITAGAAAARAELPCMCLACAPVGKRASPDVFQLPRCDVAADAPARGDSRVVSWHGSLEKFGASQLNDRFRAAMHAGMTGPAWLGWFAVKALAETAMRVGTSPAAMRKHLLDPRTQFDGHKGVPLRFDPAGHLMQPVYELRRAADGHWRVSRELPARAEVGR